MKKKTKILAILNGICAAYWIFDAIQFARDYSVIREIYSQATQTLIVKISAAVIWVVIAVVWIVRYVKSGDPNKETAE